MTEPRTIAALATAPAPAGLAVVRVSGPKARMALREIFRPKNPDLDPTKEARKLHYGTLIDFKSGEPIDNALAVLMKKPMSFTGEDVVEFQFHGSPVLVQRVLSSLFAYGIAPAEPGEFTKRAFLNGKIDLAQAEAIGDLINARSEHALKIASEQLQGRFSQAIESLGEPLRGALAEVEAAIDFPDEDIEPAKKQQIAQTCKDAQQAITNFLASYTFGHAVKEGFRVLLCGRPNAGKSSILNLILGKERAIVTEFSGTTRDLIEEEAVLSGYRFIFCDSAGLREASDKAESIGIELAKNKIPWADLVLVVVDASDKSQDWKDLIEEIRASNKKIWMVTNKIDLNKNALAEFFCDSKVCAQNFYLSAKTGDGFDSLVVALVDEVSRSAATSAETGQIITNERHKNALSRAYDNLGKALDAAAQNQPAEILAHEIRLALTCLEEIVGKTYTEDILGRIFSKFCIGK